MCETLCSSTDFHLQYTLQLTMLFEKSEGNCRKSEISRFVFTKKCLGIAEITRRLQAVFADKKFVTLTCNSLLDGFNSFDSSRDISLI